MIVGSRFFGDNNEVLAWAQEGVYWTLLPYLFLYPKGIYLRAVNYTGVETDLYRKVKGKDRFDHRVLQDAHDKIAAYYRYLYPDKMGQLILPFIIPDRKHLSLVAFLDEIYKREWCSYWYREVRKLSKEPITVRAILTAVAYQNTDDGYEAEELLLEILHDCYGKTWDTEILFSRECKRKGAAENMELPPDPGKEPI